MTSDIFQIVYALGSIGTLLGVIFLIIEMTDFHKELLVTHYQSLRSMSIEFKKMVLDNPAIWDKLFPEGYCRLKEDPKVIIASILLLDYFDDILHRQKMFKKGISELWKEYIKSTFAQSPYLRTVLAHLEEHYTPELTELKNQALNQVKEEKY